MKKPVGNVLNIQHPSQLFSPLLKLTGNTLKKIISCQFIQSDNGSIEENNLEGNLCRERTVHHKEMNNLTKNTNCIIALSILWSTALGIVILICAKPTVHI